VEALWRSQPLREVHWCDDDQWYDRRFTSGRRRCYRSGRADKRQWMGWRRGAGVCWGWRCRWNGWGHVGTVSGRESFVVSSYYGFIVGSHFNTIFIYCFLQNGSVHQTMAASASICS
jgi:hypothetical protein